MVQPHFVIDCSTNPLTYNRLASSCQVLFQATPFSWRSLCSSFNRTRKRNRAELWDRTDMYGFQIKHEYQNERVHEDVQCCCQQCNCKAFFTDQVNFVVDGFHIAFRSRERVRKATEKRACTERDEIQHDIRPRDVVEHVKTRAWMKQPRNERSSNTLRGTSHDAAPMFHGPWQSS